MELRKLSALLLASGAMLATTGQAQTLADWDFSSLTNPGIPNGSTTNPVISSTGANPGAGVTASDLVAVKAQPTFDGLLWAAVNIAAGEMNHKYWDGDFTDLGGTAHDGVPDNWIAFTLTNTQGNSIEVNRLSVSAWRNGTGAAGRYLFEVVVDGGTPQPFGSPQDDPDSGDFGYDWFHFDDSVSFLNTLEVRFQAVALPGGQGTGNLHVNGLQVSRDGLGSNYCLTTPNSTGFASTISATGSASIGANDLVLSAGNLPAQPGIFIAGPTQSQIPFFNGFLCVDPNGLQRFINVGTPAGGTITEAVDYATAAQGGLNVAAGVSYYYQRWNRDPAAGGGNADFSDAIEIVHTP